MLKDASFGETTGEITIAKCFSCLRAHGITPQVINFGKILTEFTITIQTIF